MRGAEEKEGHGTYCIGRWQMMKTGELGDMSRTLLSALLEVLKVHRILVVRVECMVV